MPTILCVAAMFAVAVASILHPAGKAWGEEAGPQAEQPESARDRVEPRTPRDVEMLRRLLEMTMQAAPAGSNAPPAPASGPAASPSTPESVPPRTSATGTGGGFGARGSVG